MDIIIRKETEADHFETEAMTRRSFWNKFKPGCDEHLLVHSLRNNPAYLPELSRVAEVDGHIAGVIMYFRSKIISPEGETEVLSFGPLCVDHCMKNAGIGGALLEESLKAAKETGYSGVLIFGEPDYYPKHGFVRAASLGLTDMDGNAYDPFMAYELVPGGLSIPGGRFDENAYGIEDELNDENLARLEAESGYEYLAEAVRPCQWTYQNASDEKDGYHLVYAVTAPAEFDSMFGDYAAETGRYDESYLPRDIADMTYNMRDDVNIARYIIKVGNETAGLLVTSVAGAPEGYGGDGCGNRPEHIWVKPGYRRRGIASDIFRRYMRQQNTVTGFRIIPSAPSNDIFLRILDEEGIDHTQRTGFDGEFMCRITGK